MRIDRYIAIILFSIVFFGNSQLRAAQVIGGAISYKYIGNDSFLVSAEYYRDCTGGQIGTYQTIIVTPDNGYPYQIDATQISSTEITPISNKGLSRCANITSTFPFGMQKVTFTGIFKLSKNVCNYTISFTECCLSGSITTGSARNQLYIEAQLNTCKIGNHDSPLFESDPPLMVCNNTCTSLSNSALPNSGDSLSYSWEPLLFAAGAPIGYTSPYDVTAPLIFDGNKNDQFVQPNCYGFHFDSLTGMINFKAKNKDRTVFSIQVNQWHKDSTGQYKIIGTITRAVACSIIDCPTSSQPIVTGINGGATYVLNVCKKAPISFTVKAFGIGSSDTVSMYWNKGIPGASFKIDSGNKWPTATFSWSPKASDYRAEPYTFIVTALDQNGTFPPRDQKLFTIYLHKDSFPKVSYVKNFNVCNDYTFLAEKDSSTVLTYNWNIDNKPASKLQTFKYHFKNPGAHTINLQITNSVGCISSLTDTIKTDTLFIPKALFSAKPTCTNMPLSIINNSRAPKGESLAYFWRFDDGSTSTSQSPIKSFAQYGSHFTWLTVVTDSGCKDSANRYLNINPGPNVHIRPDINNCHGFPANFYDNTDIQNSDSISAWNWNFGDSTFSTLQNPSHTYKGSGLFAISLKVQSKAGCIESDSGQIIINPPPNSGFTFKKTGHRTYTFTASDQTLSDYKWDFGDKSTGTGATLTHTFEKDTIYEVILNVTNQYNCLNIKGQALKINTSSINNEIIRSDLNLKLSPNPFTEALSFSFELTKRSHINIKIINITGKTISIIADGVLNEGIHDYTFKAEDYHLKPGIYSLIIESDGNKVTKEIVKQ